MKKRIVFFENTGRGTGSNVSLRAILDLVDRSQYEIILWFGDVGNKERWQKEIVYETPLGWLGNFDYFPAGFRVVWVKHFIGFLLKTLRDIFIVPCVLKKLSPDVLHINSGSSLIVGVVAKKMGIPVVWHIRELVCENWIGRLQDHIYAYVAGRVIAISNAVAGRLPYSVRRGKVIRLYNAVGSMRKPAPQEMQQFRSQFGLSDGNLVVLLLGHVSKAKGYGFLADVADQLETENIQFVLAGRRPEKGTKEEKSIFKHWDGHMRRGGAIFTGHVDASIAIACADLVVCPNLVKEPLGRTVLESYVLGKPVIAMSLPAFSETVINGQTGWLLAEDVFAWSQKLKELAANRSLLTKCSVAIAQQLEKFDDQKYIKKLQTIYSGLIKRD